MYELIVSNTSEGFIIELQKDETTYEAYDSAKEFIALLDAVWDTHMLATAGCTIVDKIANFFNFL